MKMNVRYISTGYFALALLITTGAASAETVRDIHCIPTVPLRDYAPAISLQGEENYGGDNAAEPFTLAVMQAAGAWKNNGDEIAAELGVKLLYDWATINALRHVAEVGPYMSNTNSMYSLRRAMVGLLQSWMVLRDYRPSRAFHPKINTWLSRLYRLQDTNTGGKKERNLGDNESNFNNHALLRGTIELQMALLQNKPELAQRGIARAQAMLNEMRVDGSLPRETARGARALWYQRHALASLIYMAHVSQKFGTDLYVPRADGKSLHDALSFLRLGIENTQIVLPYAKADLRSGSKRDPADQDLSFMNRRGNGRHYMAFIELYAARFPNHENTKYFREKLDFTSARIRPMIDEYAGGNTTCLFAK